MTYALRVLNTRPPPQSKALSQLLKARATQAIKTIEIIEYCPIVIAALPKLATDQQAKDIAFNLDQFTDIIVTSSFAADFGLDFLANYWPQWPETRWWAIGTSTGKSMRAFAVEPLIPEKNTTQNSESLLQAMQLEWCLEHSKKQVLIIAGTHGRGLLQTQFNATDVPYSILEVYQRRGNLQRLPIQTYDAVVITSVDIARHLFLNDHILIQFGSSCHFICASDRIAHFVKSKSATKVINCRSANNEILSESITRLIL